MTENKNIRSFTLVELLIVIAILAILSSAVVLVLNPAELIAQARDTIRVNDLNSMNKAITLWTLDNSTASQGSAQTIYLSLPDTNSGCSAYTAVLPSLASGWSYRCVTQANLYKVNGTGWMPINLTQTKGGSTIAALPVDPVNDAASGKYYTYLPGGSYEFTALMEGDRHDASIEDGGFMPGIYRAGTHVSLTPVLRDKNLIGYWSFDAYNGTALYDGSKFKNNGTMYSGVTATNITTTSGCRSVRCLSLDGVDDYVSIPFSSSLSPTKKLSVSAWAYQANWATYAAKAKIVSKTEGAGGYQMGVNNGADDVYSLVTRSGSNAASTAVRSTLSAGWHHFAVTYDGRYAKTYIDGVLMNTGDGGSTKNIIYANNNALIIGAEAGSAAVPTGEYFGGKIDEVAVYDVALTLKEVKSLAAKK